MPDEENASPPAAPLVIESGMRTGQGDESGSDDTLTIGEKYEDDTAPDPAADTDGTAEAVHDAALALGDPDYRPAAGDNK